MSDSTVSPWPRRAAWLACLATFPIFLIGGTVTTLRVGMAVPDWPTTFGQNMFTYPLGEMLASTGVFWEHSHRLWGAFVGLCVVILAATIWRCERRASVRWLALLALLGVVGQGILGGFRVTENSPELAFLHGSLAQALFALLSAILFLESQAWRAARVVQAGSRLRTLAAIALPAVYVQTVLGAWLRHSGMPLAQAVHVLFAIAAAAIVVLLAGELLRSGDTSLARVGRWLRALVWTQVALGILAWISVYILTGPHNPVSIGEAIFATAHVACGALLLGACVAALVFVRRSAAVTAPSAAGSSAAPRPLEAVR
ncbi:MAG: COX15/CtaA family protein [Planctomycetota bacterium]|nr:COX15/CtaA family protein [Planctomycetota bacterium]